MLHPRYLCTFHYRAMCSPTGLSPVHIAPSCDVLLAGLLPVHIALIVRYVVPGRLELPTSTLSVWRSNQLSYRTGRKNPRGGESNRALTSCTEDGTGRPGFIFLYNFITSCEKYRSESLEGESYLCVKVHHCLNLSEQKPMV